MTNVTQTVSMEDLLAQGPWLQRLARSLVHDGGIAEDLVQSTFLRAIRRPPDPERPLRPWLARVARNLAHDRARAESRRFGREQEVARVKDHVPDASQAVESFELRTHVAQLVLELDEPYRTAVLMRYESGLSAAAIARRLEIPAATVRSQLKRGLDQLRSLRQHQQAHRRQRDPGDQHCAAHPAWRVRQSVQQRARRSQRKAIGQAVADAHRLQADVN